MYIFGVALVLVCAKQCVILIHIANIIFLYQLRKKDSLFIIILWIYISYILCALITIQFPFLPRRAHLGDILLLLAIVIVIFQKYCNNRKIHNIIIATSLAYGIFVISSYVEFRIKWNDMLHFIDSQKANGNRNIVVDDIFKHRKIKYNNLCGWDNPGTNPDEWPNTIYAKMFEIDSFRVKE